MTLKINSQNSPPKRLVVLGKNGFIAKNLIQSAKGSNWNVEAFSASEIDLTSKDSVQKLTKVISPDDTLVFISALTPDKGRDRATLMKNLSMADVVCEAIQNSSPAQLVYVSSDAVYDDAESLVAENSLCNPSGFHGVMHLAREKFLLETAKSKNIPLLIARPCAVYGYGDTHNSYGPNRFLKCALEKGEIALSGEGEETRDHIFIDDLINIVKETILTKATGVLNIASGKAVSFFEVANLIKSNISRSSEIKFSPRQNPITHKHFDVSVLLKTFPTLKLTSIENGLKQTIQKTEKGN